MNNNTIALAFVQIYRIYFDFVGLLAYSMFSKRDLAFCYKSADEMGCLMATVRATTDRLAVDCDDFAGRWLRLAGWPDGGNPFSKALGKHFEIKQGQDSAECVSAWDAIGKLKELTEKRLSGATDKLHCLISFATTDYGTQRDGNDICQLVADVAVACPARVFTCLDRFNKLLHRHGTALAKRWDETRL